MIKNNLLLDKPKILLDDFLVNYKSIYNINTEFAYKLIKRCINYYTKNQPQPRYLKTLMDRWYDSAEKGVFDYSIYGDKYYFATDLWPCFVLYSRKYILSIKKNIEIFNAIFNSESIIDLGCGIGYSTAMLKQLFPEKEIIGTNIKDTEQYGFCVEMGEVYNFKVIESEYNITKRIDVVFASEYFEHIFDAPNNIEKLINHLKPKYLLLANTFGQKSVGHFNYYKLNDCYGSAPQLAESIKVSRIFNNVLKKAGYTQIKTGLWNNRPNFWCQNEAV